jgi:hypothetical protein
MLVLLTDSIRPAGSETVLRSSREVLSTKCQKADRRAGGRQAECRFLPIFLSTPRLIRHEEMGDPAEVGHRFCAQRRSKRPAAVPAWQRLRSQCRSVDDKLERAGKLQRTRRLTSRKKRCRPRCGAGRQIARSDTDRNRTTCAEFSGGRPSPASAARAPDRESGTRPRHRCVRRGRPLPSISPEPPSDRFARRSGRGRSAGRRRSR